MKLQANNALIINAVQMNNFLLIDDHRNDGGKLQLAAVAVYERDEKQVVVALFDKSYSDYYTINEIVIRADGLPHVTRNACGGTVFGATDNVIADIARMEASFDQELIKKHPCLAPGKISNIITRHAA